jgi:signal transduction histidine kinase
VAQGLGRANDQFGARVVVVGAIGVVTTALVYGIPPVLFAYPFPGAATFVATLSSMSALALSVLFFMRHRRNARRADLFVSVLFAVVSILEAVLPLVAELVPEVSTVAFWSRVIARTAVGLGCCVTAWLPDRTTRRATSRRVVVAAAAISTFVVTFTLFLGSSLPATVSGTDRTPDDVVRDPTTLGFRLAGTLLLIAAAVGFVRMARAQHDAVYDWLACGMVLMATARFHDFLFPSLHDNWVTTGDILRVIAQWVVLAGLLYEVGELWRRRADEAAASERRRVAAEIHDGLAQELAYISTQSSLAARDLADDEHLAKLRAAADRALGEARRVVREYGTTGPRRLGGVIAELSRDIERRYGCHVVLDLDDDIVVDSHTAHEMGRIAGEAMVNAARHARPKRISARLALECEQVQLTVADDGDGLPPSAGAYKTEGYGMTSMRERTHRLGGSYRIVSSPGGGTTVEIAVPHR